MKLLNFDFEKCTESLAIKMDNLIKFVLDTYVPIKKIRVSTKASPWFNSKIKSKMRYY